VRRLPGGDGTSGGAKVIDPRWDADPGYSSNDATHPRNRPRGWSPPGLELSEVEAAGLARAVAAALAPARPAARRPATPRRAGAGAPSRPGPAVGGGRPDGRPVTLAEKREILEGMEGRQAEYWARVGRRPSGAHPLEREWAAMVSQREAGRVCQWW